MKLLRLTMIIVLLLAARLPGMVIIYERPSGQILDCVTNRARVELYMKGRYIPAWYGRSRSVAVLEDTTGMSAELPDSVVIYSYAAELEKIGLVEILSDSAAVKIINDPSPGLRFNGALVDAVLLDSVTVLVAPGDNLEP